MKITILRRAEKQIKQLPDFVKVAVTKKIRALGQEEENVQIKKLQGRKNIYRVRVGSYRIVYQQTNKVAEILAVQHRKEVYKGKLE
ncbi:MAG: type II toxin-antitoxin system RelE/ParE family toxin [bacterium]